MGKLSRRKGAAYELYVAKKMRAVFPHARRGLGQARAGGEVPDVDGTPLWVQTKHEIRPNVFAALAQAQRDLGEARADVAQRYPGGVLVVARKSGGAEIAVLTLDDYMALIVELEILRARVPATMVGM